MSNKVGRSIKLENCMNDRLIALCFHLGVNPNAYLVAAIGKAIAFDELHYIQGKSITGDVSESGGTRDAGGT